MGKRTDAIKRLRDVSAAAETYIDELRSDVGTSLGLELTRSCIERTLAYAVDVLEGNDDADAEDAAKGLVACSVIIGTLYGLMLESADTEE